MARNRARTSDGGGDAAVATATGKAQRVMPSEPAARVAASNIRTGEKIRTDAVGEGVPAAADRSVTTRDVVVHVEVIWGGITNVKVPVAVGARYQGWGLAGPAKAFGRQLDFWLTRAVD